MVLKINLTRHFILILGFSVNVYGDIIEDLQTNILDILQENQNLSNISQDFLANSLKSICDIGTQFLVPNRVCASHLEFICKRTDILMQSKYRIFEFQYIIFIIQ